VLILLSSVVPDCRLHKVKRLSFQGVLKKEASVKKHKICPYHNCTGIAIGFDL
jgi:hypothetical protein